MTRPISCSSGRTQVEAACTASLIDWMPAFSPECGVAVGRGDRRDAAVFQVVTLGGREGLGTIRRIFECDRHRSWIGGLWLRAAWMGCSFDTGSLVSFPFPDGGWTITNVKGVAPPTRAPIFPRDKVIEPKDSRKGCNRFPRSDAAKFKLKRKHRNPDTSHENAFVRYSHCVLSSHSASAAWRWLPRRQRQPPAPPRKFLSTTASCSVRRSRAATSRTCKTRTSARSAI